mmetsp:Transcript_31884/g.28918  ORF Transcript_31884/g.28918 Transcript_31884/m.28918 type:complete len:88 (-) Transcript_31884:722-985(-)
MVDQITELTNLNNDAGAKKKKQPKKSVKKRPDDIKNANSDDGSVATNTLQVSKNEEHEDGTKSVGDLVHLIPNKEFQIHIGKEDLAN